MMDLIKLSVLGFMMTLVLCSHPAHSAAQDAEDRFLYPQYSKKISMDFKDAALMDVLKVFSKQSGMNFIAAEDLSAKKVTLFMENVPVEEALEKLLDANGLTYQMSENGDMFLVKTKPDPKDNLVTRVYQLKYATVPSSKLNKTIAISSDSSTTTGGASGPVGSTTASSESGLFAAVKTVLTKNGTMSEDSRTNSLIITDVDTQFPYIEQTIAKLDAPIPEILIEVEMLDVSKTTSDLMGIKYGDTPLTFAGGSRGVLYPWNQNDLLRKGRFAFTAPGGSSSSSGDSSDTSGQEYVPGRVSATGMTAMLQFLKTQSDTRNLARPKLLTLNNETAQIKISTNEAIGVSSVTNSSQSTATSAVQAERVQTGVFLTVTPQANLATHEITMAVSPKVIQARLGGTFSGQTFKDPEERGSQSILKVKDGETIVLGGLLREDNSKTDTKLPYLSDIPLLGSAFRHHDKSGGERELIIFITPHIVDDKNKAALKLLKENVEQPLTVVDLKTQIDLDKADAMNQALNKMESQN